MSRLAVVKRYWDLYLSTNEDERQRKLMVLDKFLKLLLEVTAEERENDHDAASGFSDMRSVSNLLAGELLVDVHHVCSLSADDDVTQLQRYLLEGRGATLLKVLNTIGIESVSCNCELAELFATLLPLCCKFPAASGQQTKVRLDNVESCFSHLDGLPVTQSLSKFPTLTEVTSSSHQSTFPQGLGVHSEWQRRPSRQPRGDSADSTDSENEDGASMVCGNRFRPTSMPPLLQPSSTSRLGVFPGLLQDQHAVEKEEEEEDKDSIDGGGAPMVRLEPLELCRVCLDLIEGLCRGDCGNSSRGRVVAFIILPHLSHLLLSLVMEVASTETTEQQPECWSADDLACFQRYLLRTTITVASQASLQPSGINFLAANSCLVTVLEAAKTAFNSLNSLGKPHNVWDPADLEKLMLVHDTLHGVFFLVHTIFYNIPSNPSILNSALKLLNDICDKGLHLFQVLLLHWEVQFSQAEAQSPPSVTAKGYIVQLVSSIGKVMKSLKKAKVDYIHTMKCLKRKHRSCAYSHYLHHHHDILGISASAFSEQMITMSDSYGSMERLSGEETATHGGCAVALLADFLIQLLMESQTRLLQIRTLHCLEEAGLCCCMSPSHIQRHLLGQLERHTPGMRNYILCVLTRILMDNCGGSKAMQHHAMSMCPVCYDTNSLGDHNGPSERDMMCSGHETSDSALSSSETSLPEAGTTKHPKWRCLSQFLPLLRHTNEALAVQVTQHLLRLISQASAVFTQQLFFSVFLPLLGTLKDQFLPQGDPEGKGSVLSDVVVQYCLSALPLLLHSQATQDMFLNSGGVRLLCAMVQTKSLRRCVLKVFQVLLVLEERSRQESMSPRLHTPHSANGFTTWHTESQQVHLGDDFQSQFGEPAGLGDTSGTENGDGTGVMTVRDAFMGLVLTQGCQVKESPNTQYTPQTTDVEDEPVSRSPEICRQSSNVEPAGLLQEERNRLSIMCDIWTTCATLFPCSQQFQQNFLEADGPQKALDILNHAMDEICKVAARDPPAFTMGTGSKERTSLFQCWLTLIEATLFICLGCCELNAKFGQQELSEASLLAGLEQKLKKIGPQSGGPTQRALCDMLLSCATTHRNMHDIVTNHTFAVMHLRIDDSDEQEVVELSDYCSTAKDSETCHTEQGYEADSEFTPDDNKGAPSGVNRLRCRSQSGRPTVRLMLYPQLCKLVLNLLIAHCPVLPQDGTLSHILLRLISLAKQNAHIASTLYNQGLVEILLGGIKKILWPEVNGSDSPPPPPPQSYHVEQCLILDLFLLISHHAFSSYELKTFLSLLKETNAATEGLLTAAISLTETFQFKPTYIVVFPVAKSHLLTDFEVSVRSVSSDMLTASFRPVSPTSEEPHSEYNQLLKSSSVQEAIDLDTIGSGDLNSIHGVTPRSPLNWAPIQMNLRDNISWPPNASGFSLSLWLRLEGTSNSASFMRRVQRCSRPLFYRDTSPDNSTDPERLLPARLRAAMKRTTASKLWTEQCLHLATVGSPHLQVELWIDPDSGAIICRRVCQPHRLEEDEDKEEVSEVAVSGLLMFDNWQHVALTYRELTDDYKTAVSLISVIVNGCYSKEVRMKWQAQPPWPSGTEGHRDSHLVLGHAMPLKDLDGPTGSWQLGNLMIFNDAVLTKELCFHLFALGPDCVSISQCDSGDLPADYTHYVNHDLLHHGDVSLDAFTGTHNVYLKNLRENLVATYAPSQSSTFNLYQQVSPFRRGQVDRGQASFNSLTHQPLKIPVRLLTDVAPQVHRSLSGAINEIGGIGVFLFLFARVVEQGSSERQQVQALHLLFSLISHNPSHAHDFREMEGYAMLAKVLTHERCCVSYALLKVLLDAMLTRPVMRYDTSSGQYVLIKDSSALIRDVQVISELLLDWRVWERTDAGVWHMGFSALEVLLRDDHPHHHFNVKQLHSISIVNRLLLICLERIQESRPSLPVPVCQSVINITSSMLGHPPDIHIVMTICDFLLLIHPAASTYVNHTPSEFYFIQKWALKNGSNHRRLQGSNSSSPLASSTPLKMVFQIDSNTRLSPPTDAKTTNIKNLVTSKLERSQSLPISLPPSRKRLPFERSQTIGCSDDNHAEGDTPADFQQALPRTVELDDLQPALKLGAAFKRDPDNNPIEIYSIDKTTPEVSRADSRSLLERTRTFSGDLTGVSSGVDVPEMTNTGGAMFYVETGSEKSSDSSTLPHHLQKVLAKTSESVQTLSLEPGNQELVQNALNSPKSVNKMDLVAEFLSEISVTKTASLEETGSRSPEMDHVLEMMREHLDEAAEDENGNSVVSSPSPPMNSKPRLEMSGSTPERLGGFGGRQSDDLNISRGWDRGESVRRRSWSTRDSPVEEEEKGLVHVSVGLLELLCTVLVMVPEADLRKILGVILRPESLLVMAHHHSPEIRKSIIRLLDIYFHRASREQREMFLRQYGFHLVAAQLYQHDVTPTILEAYCTIILGRPHALEDDVDSNMLTEMSRVQKMAIVPVLSMLESSVASVPLAHGAIWFLIKMFRKVDAIVTVMLENGLQETLCNTVAAINASSPQYNDLGYDGRQTLMQDLGHFFSVIAQHTFSTSGVVYHQYFEDCLTLLQALEANETATYGVNSEEVGNVRNIEALVLRAVFDYVVDRLETQPQVSVPLHRSLSNKVGSLFSKLQRSQSVANTNQESPLDSQSSSHSTSRTSTPNSESGTGPEVLLRNHRTVPAGLGAAGQSSGALNHNNRNSQSLSTFTRSDTSRSNLTMASSQGVKKMELSQGELSERFKKVIVTAVDFVLFSEWRSSPTYQEPQLSKPPDGAIEIMGIEKDFARFLLEFFVRGILGGMERNFFQRKRTIHNTVMWQVKDTLRMQFSRLICHQVAPRQELNQRLFALDLISNEPKCQELLKLTLNIAGAGQKLVVYLYELLVSHLDQLSAAEREEVEEVMNLLQASGMTPLRLGMKVAPEQRIAVEDDLRLWEKEGSRDRSLWLKKHEASKQRVMAKTDAFSRRISGCAMEVTQTVMNAQNTERRKFIEHIKMGMTRKLSVKKAWQQLIQQLTHQRAVWHCPESYPSSWQLDPTEGPCRVRRRLQRCHLSIKPKFIHDQHAHKLDAEKHDPPLTYLFEEEAQTSDSAALIYRLHTNEKIQHTCGCMNVTPSSETRGELLIGQTSVYFVGDEAIMDANYTQVLLGNKDVLSMTLPNEDVKEIHKRWYQLRDIGLEIFLTNGKTCLLAFENTKERDTVCQMLLSQELPSLIQSENLAAIQQIWLEGNMTNFEYLTHLNKMAGRSFNDLMQYPVFPFLLASYDTERINLEDPTLYRNLAKPVAVQHSDRMHRYIETYKWLEQEKRKWALEEPTFFQPDPYHYGSHYSNSGTVLHFLVRLPPFTQMFLVYQDQNFDLPDRTFHSMQTAWRLASYESSTDVKELIPEFFFLPEFLLNNEGFNFGVRQDGVQVADIRLPRWCEENPRLFTLIHRQVLESEHVSQHISMWIDLVFGFKQTGKAAIDAVNVFHPATYFGIEVDSIADPVRRNATKTMIKTYGQTPKQLFRTPHPSPAHSKVTSPKPKRSVLKSVSGLRWGSYLGSPNQPEPVMAWSQNHGSTVASLVALPTDDIFGLGLCSCLLIMYSKEKGVTVVNTTNVQWAAIVSWGHPDGIVRIQNRRNSPAVNFLHWGTADKVTCCASVPDCRLLFFGSTSGVVSIFNTKFNMDKSSNLQMFGGRQCLYGHGGAITSMYVSKAFSVLVTASRDCTAIVWDLNRLCYVRSIEAHTDPVQHVTVSDTSGDIVTVSHTDSGSALVLHTVNAALVAYVTCDELIHCVAFTSAAEGRSVNVIAAGLSNGIIRFWSSWDLTVVRDISWDKFTRPIISLTFTHDSQRMYASDINGTVAMWEKPGSNKTKAVKFVPFL